MTTWNLDAGHSEIGFKVKHLMVSTVRGMFGAFSGTLTADDDAMTNAKVSFQAETASLTTHNAMRDGHLMSPDFFDAANNPKVTFMSKSFAKKDGNTFEIVGDLTMRGVTKEETLTATFGGIMKSPVDGIRVAAFDVMGKINRKDYGIAWNANTETGGAVVSDEVVLDATVEFKEATA